MIPHKQMFRHNPAEGSFGDCDRTVMACVLELPLADVPNWGVHHDNYAEFMRAKDEWLSSVGNALRRLTAICNRKAAQSAGDR